MKTIFSKTAVRHLVVLSAAILFLFALAGCKTPLKPSAKADTSLAGLRTKLDEHINQPRFHGATWGVKIASLDTGRILYEHHPDRLMSPASNSKLYTGALALEALGGDYQFTTPILATAKVDAGGTIAGDLIVSGRGDPSWKGTNFAAIFNPFIAVLAKAGVKTVTGDLIADATFIHGLPTGGSWTVEDLEDSDGAEISALTLADNAALIDVLPGENIADPCRFSLDPPGTTVNLVNRTTTVPAGGRSRLQMVRLPGSADIIVLGQLPLGGREETLDVPVPVPARWFGTALKSALASHGILIKGGVQVLSWPEKTSWSGTNLYQLGVVQSPPLRDVIRSFMKVSQNLETDLVFDHVGELTRTTNSPAWEISESLAVQALGKFLRSRGIPADAHFDEGSGLSRNNLTSANTTVALLTLMATNRWSADYYNALPVAGVDGTLRNRMKTTAAFKNVHAKTGTLRWANSLSGYMTTAAGEKLVFSLMLNRYASPPEVKRTDELDAITSLLAGFKGHSGD